MRNFNFQQFEPDGIAIRVFWTILGSVAAPIIGGLLNAAQHIPFSGAAVAILAVVGGTVGFLLSPTDRDHAQNQPMYTRTAADQKFNELVQPTDSDANNTDRETRIVDIMSFIVVILVVIGMVVGIMLPGIITGAILPVATTLWFILYMWMVVIDQKDN